jgi:haloalkane dehalogenase
VIGVLADAGLRVIAPDNIGYGRSDKLTDATDYTFKRHVDWLHALVTALDLRDVTLVAQDWGGPLGLSVLARDQDRFARVVAANTILHTCDPTLEGQLTWAHHGVGEDRMMLQETLLDYVAFYQRAPDIVPSFFLDAVAGPLPADVLAAYDAPFPDKSYKAGLRQLIALIPLTRNDPGAAIGRATMAVLEQWEKPFLTAYSDDDPATRGWDRVFQQRVPGARGQNHVTVTGAGHFVQEQRGEELGRIVADFVAHTSSPAD